MNYPKNANIFMFILIIFLIFVGDSLLFLMVNVFPNIFEPENIWIPQATFAIFCFITPIILYMIIKRISIKELVPLKPLSIKNFFIVIFIAFTMQPMLQLIASITNIFHKDEISDVVYAFASLSLPKALFVSAIVPAITEELVFRGVILTGYKKTSILIGVLMSSFYFGIMHFTVTQLFYAIVAGVIFAFVVKVTKSIYASILMHFILNGTQITMANLIIKYVPDVESQLSNTSYTIIDLIFPIMQFIFSLPLFLLAIFLFMKANEKEVYMLIEENKLIKNSEEKPKVFTIFFYINIIVYIGYMIIKTFMT